MPIPTDEDKIVIEEAIPRTIRSRKQASVMFWIGFLLALIYLPVKSWVGLMALGATFLMYIQHRAACAGLEVLEAAKKRGQRVL
jgi:hypothetical protein